MAPSPEQRTRQEVDRLLGAAGWAVQDMAATNLHAARGVTLREFPLEGGQGLADYVLYVDGKACGMVEATKEGATLTGVQIQSARYVQGPLAATAFVNHFTGAETHFARGLGPDRDEFVALFQGRRPDRRADHPANRHQCQARWSAENPDGRWRVHDHDELVARDKASVDIFWLKDVSLAESDNLPSLQVIAKKIVADLEAALEQFRLIAADLHSSGEMAS